MKIFFVFISVVYLVHSFTLEEEKEALELSEEIAVGNAESLQAEDEVEERKRKCTARGKKCTSDCECCYDDWDHCSCWFGSCSCVTGTINHCDDKRKKCPNKPKQCSRPGQNTRNQG
uniref:Putative neurotoxin LTDF 02-02 n=1 Tax=Dolomedes fimbriatus TaxID=1432569 RepID=A0A0K1D8M9_9ARAC|nr:putative neurotoxin LTDF 02-02 [Dolomedes fimbriatus]